MLLSSVSLMATEAEDIRPFFCRTCEERCCRSLNRTADSLLYRGFHGCSV